MDREALMEDLPMEERMASKKASECVNPDLLVLVSRQRLRVGCGTRSNPIPDESGLCPLAYVYMSCAG